MVKSVYLCGKFAVKVWIMILLKLMTDNFFDVEVALQFLMNNLLKRNKTLYHLRLINNNKTIFSFNMYKIKIWQNKLQYLFSKIYSY